MNNIISTHVSIIQPCQMLIFCYNCISLFKMTFKIRDRLAGHSDTLLHLTPLPPFLEVTNSLILMCAMTAPVFVFLLYMKYV